MTPLASIAFRAFTPARLELDLTPSTTAQVTANALHPSARAACAQLWVAAMQRGDTRAQRTYEAAAGRLWGMTHVTSTCVG